MSVPQEPFLVEKPAADVAAGGGVRQPHVAHVSRREGQEWEWGGGGLRNEWYDAWMMGVGHCLTRHADGKGGDVGQRDVRTGHGRDVGVDVRLVGMGWLESMVGGRRGE